MKASAKKKGDLDRELAKVLETPAGFGFFAAVHDFVEAFEAHPLFASLKLPAKYAHLKEVHRGIKDLAVRSNDDLGHARHMAIQDLLRIRSGEAFDSNPIWKKREVLRTLSVELHKTLNVAREVKASAVLSVSRREESVSS